MQAAIKKMTDGSLALNSMPTLRAQSLLVCSSRRDFTRGLHH